MLLYKIALFLHVSGALMLCTAMAIEWLGVINIRKVDTLEGIREFVLNYSRLKKIGGAAIILILIPGIYMMVVVWHGAAWIMIGFIGLILLGAIGGGITGRKMRAIENLLTDKNTMTPQLETFLSDKAFLFSIKIRTAIFLGIIFLMTVKTDLVDSLITLAAAIVFGFVPLKVKTFSKEIQNIEQELN